MAAEKRNIDDLDKDKKEDGNKRKINLNCISQNICQIMKREIRISGAFSQYNCTSKKQTKR